MGRKGSLFLPVVPVGECSSMSQAVLGPCVLPSWALRLWGPRIQCRRAAPVSPTGLSLHPARVGYRTDLLPTGAVTATVGER